MSRALLVHARYAAGALLGRGAQGYVLSVADREAPERPLVAKVWESATFDASALAAEFSLLRRLDVPGLVRAHDFGRDEQSGAPFLVEDFVAGRPATEVVQGRVEELRRILIEVAATLSALHDAGFVHGDVKPEHVRVTPEGRVFLLDLGAALQSDATASRSAFTPAFAAPELLAGAKPSPATDLYSLGALAWCLASGRAPKLEPGPLRRVAAWVPPSTADVIDALLAPHPCDRPLSADDVLCRLGSVQASRRSAPAPIGRERELLELCKAQQGVRYLVGASGSGKSHLLRELSTRVLLGGRRVRRVTFPSIDSALTPRLIAFLRGSEQAFPFPEPQTPLLLVLDDFHAAPFELTAALEAYRCRAASALPLDVIAAVRSAPAGAPSVALPALDGAAFDELCRALGVSARARELRGLSGGQPGVGGGGGGARAADARYGAGASGGGVCVGVATAGHARARRLAAT